MACATATPIVEENHPQDMPNLVGLSRDEIADLVKAAGEPAFRAKQLWHWLYWQGVQDVDDMHNLSKKLRDYLKNHACIERPDEARSQISEDGTRKWLFAYKDNQKVETVYIPDTEEARGSLCISSQVGCTLTCTFCHTGTMKLVRNLTAAEIVQQFMVARDALGEWPTQTEARLLSNIVMMGMGEPLFNYNHVVKALRIIMDPEGLSLSKRRITLSTSGVVPKIRQLGDDLGVNLAISLHAVNNELRDELVPLNKKYPIAELLQACREYPAASNARRITFEYVMLRDVNDSDAEARELVRLLKGIPSKVNLIPFNPWPGSQYETSSIPRMQRFAEVLNDAGLSAPIRMPRGKDILAACGQLKSDSERQKRQRVQL
jgi:23S rRNA (adenine2503-C2)-methyltransferase